VKSWEAFQYLDRVQDELAAARFSLDRAVREAHFDPTILAVFEYPLKPSYIRDSLENLEPTYVLRLFAEFEAVVRNYWESVRPGRSRRTRMELLLDRVAARRYMPAGVLSDAHDVREFRNRIVHDRVRAATLSFQDCKRQLAVFISYLPRQW
jgi:hypothetical protein